jgi:large subunit ribosomal protein L10
VLRSQKEGIVTEIQKSIHDAQAVILTTFSGLNVEKMTSLRNALRQIGCEYRVVKNTLIKKASQQTLLEQLAKHFTGSSAVVIARKNPIGACRALREFKKEHTQVEVKGGMLEGRILSASDIDALASLPAKEVLLGKLLFLLRAPHQRLANVLGGLPQKLVLVLDAIRRKKESQSE